MKILSTIQKVDAPPFLLTRIEREIARLEKSERVSPTMAWSLGLSFLFVVTINITLVTRRLWSANTPSVIEMMHISPTNDLYYE
jgi:hypothetical protein